MVIGGPLVRKIALHLVEIESITPMDFVFMVGNIWHCPAIRGVLFALERNNTISRRIP